MQHETATIPKKKDHLIAASILISSILLAGSWIYKVGRDARPAVAGSTGTDLLSVGKADAAALEEKVLPKEGVALPVVWGDLGQKLTRAGAIDEPRFRALYAQRGGLTDEEQVLLSGRDEQPLRITNENAPYLLNLFWALGLANKNPILEKGEMMNPAYGGAGNFASTGGWTLAKGSAMDHYSVHTFVTLTANEQALVERVSQGIYRPCCGNSTHFPDCNHGMAMLGMLELMASQGASEDAMWRAALAVNAYWFPENYLTIATYMKTQGTDWTNVDPRIILGATYSSNVGYMKIATQVTPPETPNVGGGSGCGVDAPIAAPARRPSNGCGL